MENPLDVSLAFKTELVKSKIYLLCIIDKLVLAKQIVAFLFWAWTDKSGFGWNELVGARGESAVPE